jgi:hypothetical protein
MVKKKRKMGMSKKKSVARRVDTSATKEIPQL